MARRRTCLASDRSGVAALEFGIVAPVMLVLCLGSVDIVRALVMWQEVQSAAENAAYAGENLAYNGISTAPNLTIPGAAAAMSTIYGNIPNFLPQLISGQWQGLYGVNMSAVEWYTIAGVETPWLLWTATLGSTGSGSMATTNNYDKLWGSTLTCGAALNQVATIPGTAANLTSIPTASITNQAGFIKVDIKFEFVPLLPITFITGSFYFYASFYAPPVSTSVVNNTNVYAPPSFDGGATGDGYNCGNPPPNS